MAKNNNLHKAKAAKNDEFYTRIEDIEKELQHYTGHFKDKVVYCNCDDPTHSNFWKYFHLEFERLGLKKLIATHYEPDEVPSYMMEYTGGNDEDFSVGIRKELTQNGDFRSPECIKLLKEADIVVTNPPFSLFREYVAHLVEYDKKFIILGNMNSITYKEFFPLIKENKVWAGYSFNKTFEFIMPDSYELKGKAFIDNEGKKHGFVPAICWFTNLDFKKRHEPLETVYSYARKDDLYPDLYPKYDNYDAINVDKVSQIPMDYDGVMGVPITFLDKYCPEQFKILGCSANPEANELQKKEKSEAVLTAIKQNKLIGAKCVGGNSNLFLDNNGYLHVLYHRLFIQKKG